MRISLEKKTAILTLLIAIYAYLKQVNTRLAKPKSLLSYSDVKLGKILHTGNFSVLKMATTKKNIGYKIIIKIPKGKL